MKKIKKLLILNSFVVVPTFFLLSCASALERNRQEFDFGVSTTTINTLNYVKNNSSHQILNSLVESFVKPGPSASNSYGAKLNLPAISFELYNTNLQSTAGDEILQNPAGISPDGSSFTISDFGLALGSVAPSSGGAKSFVGIQNSSQSIVSTSIFLNKGASKWANNQPVIAQNFIDYILYVLNINVASPNLVKVLSLNIKNAQKMISLQQDYVSKFGNPYLNPFGQKRYVKDQTTGKVSLDFDQKVFESQNAGDEEYVAQFKENARNFGMYTGQIFEQMTNKEVVDLVQANLSLNPNFSANSTEINVVQNNQRSVIKLTKNPFLDPSQVFDGPNLIPRYDFLPGDEYGLRIQFEDSAAKKFINLFRQIIHPDIIFPINREFVEIEAGGINNFGTDLSKFLINGPFDISELNLGSQGSMILTKRQGYYSSDKTIPNKIKVFFAEQPELLSSLFLDGYIAKTKIPSTFQSKFWSEERTRRYMEKQTGYGTIGIQVNLDNVKKGKSYLQDSDLRKAILYGINRIDLLNLYGLDHSFPQTTWTNFDSILTSRGYPLETFLENRNYRSEFLDSNGKQVEFPVLAQNYGSHLAKGVWFESVPRVDSSYSPQASKFFLERFKKNNPNVEKVKLTFIYKDDAEEKVAIGLQDILARNTNNFIEIDPVRLPDGIYQQRLSTGDFDLTMKNFDFFNIGGSQPHSYIKAFFNTDEISPSDNKFSGLESNPASSMTYWKMWNEISPEQRAEIAKRLEISDIFLKKFEELITRKLKLDGQGKPIFKQVYLDKDQKIPATDYNNKPILVPEFAEPLDEYNNRIDSFFNAIFTHKEKQEGWTQNRVFEFVLVFEKIIREFAPIIPVMEVDTFWTINRIRAGSGNSFQFAFDVENIKVNFVTAEDGKQ
ncbi:ABC-type oligopeptide transport system, periplasmic component [Mesomycoplasma ovipneumoniae]|nr:ABC-type oligopeptide transport system, periplasmic component [Mesomycoplasma ovipneumoniae]